MRVLRRLRLHVLGSVAAATLLLAAPSVASAAPTVAGPVLVVAPHPDDDVITAAGITSTLSEVTIAFVTNGDFDTPTDPVIAQTRQDEAVAAQVGWLGRVEDDLVFLGYPDDSLAAVWSTDAPAVHTSPRTSRTATYAPPNGRGLGGTDWHDYRTGSVGQHGDYNRDDMLADMAALIDARRPTHIFTTNRWDGTDDHATTYDLVTAAIDVVTAGDPSYRPVLHSTIVWHPDETYWNTWPQNRDPTAPTAEAPDLEAQTSGELVWSERERFIVPAAMQDPDDAQNPKSQAIAAHASQGGLGDFIGRFVHLDEVFWADYPNGPLGAPDAYATSEGGTIVTGPPGLLDNDWGATSAQEVAGPSNGTLSVAADGSFTYTHDGSETTTDSFTYRPMRGSTPGSITTVSITISPVNDAPIAQDDGPYPVDEGGSKNVPAPGVLGNDSDPEGGSLTAVLVSGPSNGTLSLAADGSFTYTHDGSDTTTDSFTYKAKDASGAWSAPTTVSFQIGASTHTVALVDPAQGLWHLFDADGNQVDSFFFGNPGDVPIYGDWDCDGVETPGMYRQSDGYVYLRNSNSQGVADIRFFFGDPGDIPLAGDFDGDGCDTVSIFRPSEGRVFIINELGKNDGGLGAAEFDYYFGNPGDKPFVGDFDGDGKETVGLHRESTGLVYFRNSHTQGVADAQFIYGDPGDRIVAGDWNGDGRFSPALFRPSDTTMYFRFTNSQGVADDQWTAGESTWLPVSGTSN